jgi:hypothetical protein
MTCKATTPYIYAQSFFGLLWDFAKQEEMQDPRLVGSRGSKPSVACQGARRSILMKGNDRAGNKFDPLARYRKLTICRDYDGPTVRVLGRIVKAINRLKV